MPAASFSGEAAGENVEATFRRASDQSLLVNLGGEITPASYRRVVKLVRLLEREPVAGIGNLHPGYCSVLVKFDALVLTHEDVENALKQCLVQLESVPAPAPREVEIPVRYGDEFGPDLEEVAAAHGLTRSQTIEQHASGNYFVYFLGFLPGFAYLGGLAANLATPRLSTPRKIVPAGSVGIAGAQTGIYPLATPGGWRLIGRTPLELFRPDREPMSLLSIGDRVRFKPVSRDEFVELQAAAGSEA